ncbi:MAG: hypothetical protein O2955_15570 [Planctomycetota bacterium]|nr:hypothetical protein [Planctomycetota bacterium]
MHFQEMFCELLVDLISQINVACGMDTSPHEQDVIREPVLSIVSGDATKTSADRLASSLSLGEGT